MSKLRQSILAAVDRNLRKFEDKVRNTRDKRTEANWDFINYFLCHVSIIIVMIDCSISCYSVFQLLINRKKLQWFMK